MSEDTPVEQAKVPYADRIVRSRRILTLDTRLPIADALAVKGSQVLAVGDYHDLRGLKGPDTEVVELAGACVMPGLHDVHVHPGIAGRAELYECTFRPESSLEEVLQAVERKAATADDGDWIVGGNWGGRLLPELQRAESLRRLDAVSGSHPVMLKDSSQHNRWVNSKAMALGGITSSTGDPDGRILRDLQTGEATGVLLEPFGRRVELAFHELAPSSLDRDVRSMQRGIAILSSHGITALQDAAASAETMRALKHLDEKGELNAWVISSVLANDPVFGSNPVGPALIGQAGTYRSKHHRPDFVKIFLDGVPSTRTAAFLEPYLADENAACVRGHTVMEAAELQRLLTLCTESGLGAKIHCTGDAAVRMTLDAVQKLRSAGALKTKIQIAHGQYIHPGDLPRFAELDVIADISPPLWYPTQIHEAMRRVLPENRLFRGQPNRNLIDSGACVAAGSDWPVHDAASVWPAVQGLITRADPTGRYPGRLWPEQALTVDEAIACYTTASTRAMGLDRLTGSLTAGKSADFIVLDRDPFEDEPHTIGQTKVEHTWFGGRCVYQSGGLQ